MVLAPPRRGFGVAARAVGHADGLSSACRSAGVLLAAIFSVSLHTRISRRARRSGRTAPPSPLDSGGVSGHPIIPSCGHRIFLTPPDRGGRAHERDNVVRTGASGRGHWPRGHTTRGGTNGPRGLLAASPSVVPR